MRELLDSLKEIHEDVVRNIVNILPLQEVFSDLLENNREAANLADKMIQRVMHDNDLQFHYTTAITYPFESDHFMNTRYSDGTFAVWYGCLDRLTTIHETVHHMIQHEMNIANILNYPIITRERVVYHVFCQGILIDLSKKAQDFPKLITDDYSYTQQLGKLFNQQGYPGLLSPSARHHEGININIFKQDLLSNPRVSSRLTYKLFTKLKKVEVSDGTSTLCQIDW